MNEQEIEAHRAREGVLMQAFLKAAEGYPHEMVLDVLMALYVGMGQSHSCCTRYAALMCVSAASQLQNATLAAPQGVALH